MKVIAFIPAFNECHTIRSVVENVRNFVDLVIVVDDGSVDNTVEEAKAAGAHVISHTHNRGVGASFKTGFYACLNENADIMVTLDGDGQFNPEDIPRLIAPIIEDKADFVTGSRFLDNTSIEGMGKTKHFGNRIFTSLVNFFTKLNMSDTQCGFRAYGREALYRMVVFGEFTYTQEVFLDLAYKNLRISEIPIVVKPRLKGKSRVVKNPFSYGFRALKIIMLAERDHHPLRFFGTIGGVGLAFSVISGLVVFINWLFTGKTSPYSSLIVVSGVMALMGFTFIVLAIAVEMLGRQRTIQEEILYYIRKNNKN